MNDVDALTMSNDFNNYYDLKIKSNKAMIYDDSIFSNSYESKTYYSTEIINYRAANNQAISGLLRMFVRLSTESEQNERVVYSFFDMFGYLGGLFDFLYFIGYICVGYFNETYYNHTLFTKLYQVEQQTMIPNSKLFDEKPDVAIAPKVIVTT